MAMELRGTFPVTVRFTAASAPADAAAAYRYAPQITRYLRIRNDDGTNFLKVYFTVEDFTADTNFVRVDAQVATKDTTLREPFEVKELWFRADTADVIVELTWGVRRG